MSAVLAVLLLGLAPSVPAVVERTDHYDVAGSSEHELRAAINARRPKDDEGIPHDGLTNWDVRWKYRYVTTPEGCAVASVATTLDVVTILPRWSNRQAGSTLAQRWDKYIAALEDHEREHMQIALRAARMIQQRLSSLEIARTCPLLEESINLTGQTLLDQFRSDDDEYDRRTKHGASQGARFP